MTKKTNYRREFSILFLIVATELIGFGLIIPILPQIALQFNVNGFWMGLLLSSYSIAQLIASPILGSLSDKYGRKPILMISKLGTFLSYVLLAYSFSFPLFLLARSIDGFTGGNIAVARAYITDITKKEDRAKGMAIIGISFGVGFIIGPALGGLLFGTFDTHTIPSLVAGSLSLLAFGLTTLLLKEPAKHSHINDETPLITQRSLLKNKGIFTVCLVQFLFMIVFSGFETSFSVFTHHVFSFTKQDNSLLFFYIGLLALLVQGGIVRKSFKNLRGAIIIGLTLTSLTFFMLSLSQSLWILYVALILLSLGIGLLNTHLPALLSDVSHNQKAGKVMGIYDSIGSLSRIIGPLLIYTTFFTQIQIGYMVYGLLLAGTILYFLIKSK